MAKRTRIRPKTILPPAKFDPRQNLKPFKKGHKGAKPKGAVMRINKLFREQVAEGLNTAGDFLLRKAELEEEILRERLIRRGADPESLYNKAKFLRHHKGGIAGYIAWAAIEEPKAFATVIARLFGYNLRTQDDGNGGIEFTEGVPNANSAQQQVDDAIAEAMTLQELEDELRDRGFPIPKLIDVTPKVINPNVADPNPVKPQGKTIPVPGQGGSGDDEE